MDITRIITTFISTNTYILHDGGSAVVVDPGGEYERLTDKLRRLNLTCAAVLLTHGHFDHINAAAQLQRDGIPVYIHRADEWMCLTESASGARFRVNPFKPDVLLSGGETLELGGMKIEVLHTPGHTAGSVCYLAEGSMFSGDTLFRRDTGRTDLPSGSEDELQYSIKHKLFSLGLDYDVYPGHGETTTLFEEKAENPYVGR